MNDTRNESLVDTTRNEDTFQHESGTNSTVQDGMGLPTRIDEVRYQIEWERRLLQQERELVKRERELLERESRMGTNSQNQHVHYHNNAQQVIPEFDPGKTNSFIATQWIKTVENLANIFKWDSNTLLFNASAKLSGAAKMWFEGTQGQIYDWDTFKRQIILDFPTAIDDADIHFELSKRKKKTDESYENYIYCMKAIASKGNLSEKAILKYIIAGINDKDLARLLALSGPLDVRDLLSKLKSYENTINMQVKPTVSTATTSSFRAQDKTTNIKCYNCNEFGHISIKCPKQQRKVRCFKCEKTGHMAKDCPTNKSKAVNRISEVDPLTDPYHKKIKLNDKETFAFVDLGSDVVTLRKKDAAILGCKYEPCSVILKGFGGERYPVLGKGTYTIEIDGIEFETEVCVVPDQCQDDAIIIGRNMLDEPDIKITKEGSVLKIERIKEKQISNPKNENWDDTETEDEQIQQNNRDVDDNTEDDARAEEWIHGEENRNETVLDIDYKVNEKITEEEKERLHELLQNNSKCFAKCFSEIGLTNKVEMKIELTSQEPVTCRPYRLPYAKREIVTKTVDELIEAGIVRPSNSSYASPVVLVGKRTGGDRMCIDYRKLNSVTKKEYVVPTHVEEQLDHLSGKRYFTTLDLSSGYYQIPVAEECRHLTAFVTNDGVFEFTRVPFGLVNSPSVFNRLMRIVCGKLQPNIASVYMDDILIASETVDAGLAKLELVLKTFKEEGLTLNLRKCCFLMEEVEYLGMEVNGDGIRPGPRKIDAVRNFKCPENVHEIRQFLGLSGYFRKFVKNYSIIAKPLTLLTRKDQKWIWSEEQQQAFQTIRDDLVNRPILTLYDHNASHEVHTDASKVGLAGILLQKSASEPLRPVAYFSRQTSDLESQYHSFELECLAVLETVERFRVYLLGRKFTVVTDCNSLKTMMKKRELTPRVARWILRLQEFDFDVEHRAGSKMAHVDALSRQPNETHQEVETASLNVFAVRIHEDDWLVTMQLQDPKLTDIRQILQQRPKDNNEKQIHHDYKLEKNRLYRKVNGETKWVVPKAIKWRVIKGCHDDMGHYGVEKTLQHVKRHYWFPRMRKRVKGYIDSCIECAYHKRKTGKAEAELHNIERIPIPFHTANIDHLGPFPKSTKRNTHILVYIDNFTKYVCIEAVRDTTTKNVIKSLERTFTIFGPPQRLISDRGTAFTSKNFQSFCRDHDIQHIQNATATPRANGQVERYNQTIMTAVTTTYKREDGRDWDMKLNEIQYALNSMVNKTTGKSAHDLLFGFQPRNTLQNKLTLALESDEPADVIVQREEAFNKITQGQARQKYRFDQKRKHPRQYKLGDLVLIRRDPVACGESRKLRPLFKGPYEIKKVLGKDRYLLTDIEGAQRTQRKFQSVFPADVMKPWCEPYDPGEIGDDSTDSEAECEEKGNGNE